MSLDRHRLQRAPLLVFLLLLGGYSAHIFWNLDEGHTTHWDTHLTAERSREFLVADTVVTVHQNFEPTYAKPPLYYLQSAMLLELLDDKELAIRFWSVVYGLACFILLGWLCAMTLRPFDWAIPASAVLLGLASFYYVYVSQALLDSGAAFFLLLTVIGVEKARSDPRWWWLAVAGAVLGALEKYTLGLVYWAIVLLIRGVRGEHRGLSGRKAYMMFGVGLVGSLAWPALQVLLGGFEYAQAYHGDFAGRVQVSIFSEITSRAGTIAGFVIERWGIVGLSSVVALCVVLVAKRFRRNRTAFELAIFILGYFIIMLVIHRQSVRYLIPIAPLLVYILVSVIATMTDKRVLPFLGVVVLAIALSTKQIAKISRFSHADRSEQVALAELFGSTVEDDEALFYLIRRQHEDFRLPMLLFYGDLRRPVYDVNLQSDLRWPEPESLRRNRVRGIARLQDQPKLAEHFSDVQVEVVRGDYLMFTAEEFVAKPGT